MIKIENLCKTYIKDNEKIKILNNINYTFEKGNIYAIMGHSGSGKSTLLHILGTILEFDNGKLYINNKDVSKMNSKQKANIRKNYIGFVFQNYLLNNNLKAYENVIIPMYINEKISKKQRKEIAISLLKKVGLANRINHYPKELSGGEQQRVALARALANNPNIILADEPTGNLDKESEKLILEIFQNLRNEGKCIIIVSHDNIIKNYADIVLYLNNGNMEVECENI